MRLLCVLAITLLPANAEYLQITWYEDSALSKVVREQTFEMVREIFRRVGIQVDLRMGDPTSAEGRTILYEPVVDEAQRCGARRDIALAIEDAAGAIQPAVLGTAMPLASTGLNVRVFANHIALAAARAKQPFTAVLASAIAHEIGHVLLRSGKHEANGLMAAAWREREYWLMSRMGTLRFTREQARQMQATLSGSDCASLVSTR